MSVIFPFSLSHIFVKHSPYRKMQVSGATTDLASKGQGVSDSSNIKFKEPELEVSHKMDKVRCLCGSSLQADSMIKVM